MQPSYKKFWEKRKQDTARLTINHLGFFFKSALLEKVFDKKSLHWTFNSLSIKQTKYLLLDFEIL